MFSKNLKYTLMTLMLLGGSGCTQRTITLDTGRQVSTPRVYPPIASQSVPIKEEILIKKNPNLGAIISSNSHKSPTRATPPVATTTHGHDANLDSAIDQAEMESAVKHHDTIMERMPFPAQEYARLKKRGYSTVIGTVYLENSNSGEKIVGQKVKLWLNPVTSYSNQWYQEDYLGGYKLSEIDKRIFNYMKLEYSKSDGTFRFSGIPKGDYYLVGSVKCTEACGLSDKNKKIRLVKRVSVGSGLNRIDLTKNVP